MSAVDKVRRVNGTLYIAYRSWNFVHFVYGLFFSIYPPFPRSLFFVPRQCTYTKVFFVVASHLEVNTE